MLITTRECLASKTPPATVGENDAAECRKLHQQLASYAADLAYCWDVDLLHEALGELFDRALTARVVWREDDCCPPFPRVIFRC